jgi:type II restriction/modification system DNA methylase subunit YeeA
MDKTYAFKEIKPKKALNKAFLKVKPNRTEIEGFKTHLITLLDRTNDTESEEFHKNLISDFLKDTYYKQNHFINTKGRNDLVIHNGNNASSSVGVIMETKKPTNKAEMMTTKKLNVKAFQELVLYYLRERITHKNVEVKHLVATNINEWFIFDATLFDRLFAQNKNFVKQFTDFEGGRLADTKTDFFYKQIAEPFIADLKTDIEFTYFDLQEYQKPLRNDDKADDNKLIALFKLLSAEHLLKLPFTNDSNSLDKRFYSELLHIIGLTETKEGSKKLIERNKEGERNAGSILEDAIIQLDSLDKISRLDRPSQFGSNQQERLFNVGLELSITWINRILFLKLLEAQLITYHKGDKSYSFLKPDTIKNYDDLNSLFFQVLARQYEERNQDVKKVFEKVPYLNSSLFEPTEMEQVTLFISNLKGDGTMPVISTTVLKNDQGKKRTGNLTALAYLFEFLNAYDFTSEGSEEIQEDNKSLINASVLGLIFEKINGYKDGSFFTPGFITMYMCRETIRKAVVQKFNEYCLEHDFPEVKMNVINDIYALIPQKIPRKKANEIINSIKICDPAVGSGHFLVSALNEMIAVKNDLKILEDKEGKSLHRYEVEVVNDELIVTDEEGELFEYNPNNKESQRIQETLFHEKQTIIENCLFGVDINPNSVKICRLRLWIELLKNAYYKNATELETLPNIDINIKCGNSLVSRFAIDADLKQALKKSKWSIDSYRIAVDTYRNAENKEQKRDMERLIAAIKSDFTSEIEKPFSKKISEARGKAEMLTTEIINLTSFGEKIDKLLIDRHKKAVDALSKLETERDDIKANKIFENAFEWRFEFPEVLNDDGEFVGFDVVIGNPPYVQLQSIKEISKQLERFGYLTFSSMGDLYALFYEKGNQILKEKGVLCFISGSAWMRTNYGQNLRTYFNNYTSLLEVIDLSDCDIFDSATVLTTIITFEKSENKKPIKAIRFTKKDQNKLVYLKEVFDNEHILIDSFPSASWVISDNATHKIKSKVERQGKKLIEWGIKINRGILTGYNDAFIIDGKTKDELIAKDPKCFEILKPLLRGRDTKRYYYDFEDLWLIATFPSLNIDIELYPSIKQYLQTFGKRIEQSGEKDCRKKTSGKWFETQDSIAYWADFEKPKIIYPNMTKFLPFTFDKSGFYTNQKCFILTGNNLEYLVSFFNSKLFKYCFEENFPELQGNTRELNKIIFEQIPVKTISDESPFIEKVNQILAAKKQQPTADTTDLENQIDQLVYQLYELTDEEIKIIEAS